MAITGKSAVRVDGLEDALMTLNNQVKKIPLRTLKGMIAGGLTMQRKAQKLVPVDLANLKASAFTTWRGSGASRKSSFKGEEAGALGQEYQNVTKESKESLNNDKLSHPEVEVGFTAYYALFVHEDLEAEHPNGGEAKFLQKAAVQSLSDILKAIETETVMKGSD